MLLILIFQLVLQLMFYNALFGYLRYNKPENTYEGSVNMHIEEFDNVLLKDGQTAVIVDKLSEDTFIADIGDSPEDWDTITITIDDIKKVVYSSKKTIDGWEWKTGFNIHRRLGTRSLPCLWQSSRNLQHMRYLPLQNTGRCNIDGGPNKMTLAEAKEAFEKGFPIT